MKRGIAAFAILFLLMLAAASNAKESQSAKTFTIEDLIKTRRVSDPQISPDGRNIVYTITDTDKSANRRTTQIYLISVDGGDTRQLTNEKASANSPRWSPDGRRLAYISARDGESQVWTIDVESGESRRVTSLATGAANPVWSPDGKWIAFTSEVYPDCGSDNCNRLRAQAAASSKVKAKTTESLLYRHWTTWKDGKRNHIFVVAGEGGEARDLTPGDYDAPPFVLGGMADYSFSPDSKELAFARNTDRVEALSTNGDVFVVGVSGGEARRITGENPGNDVSPRYSADGRYIAYRAQVQAGYESDRWRLMLYDRRTGQTHCLTDAIDANIESFVFAPSSDRILAIVHERARHPIYEIPLTGASIRRLISDGFNDELDISTDGRSIVFTRQSLTHPAEICRSTASGGVVNVLTHTNDAAYAEFNFKPAEEVTWEGAGGAKVQGWLIRPANFSAARKWPLIVLIHGGPQGAWDDAWSYRWNPQVFAAAGYIVFMPNPRGSTSFGQKFTEEISGDWAGKVYADVISGVAYVATLPFVDRERIGAAGGSFGGYMVNWIAGHNEDSRVRFKALVSHAGPFNLVSFYGATDELWFPEWEFKGTPWTNADMYRKWSPHLAVKDFRTPTLVIHGELDYRVPVTEGLQMFTALQRQGVESKLLVYPDEGHWILKPQNSELWYNTVLDWFERYLVKPKAQP
jgi:dipeptidyl aminopeptidase/acylaminoacyl peptidase